MHYIQPLPEFVSFQEAFLNSMGVSDELTILYAVILATPSDSEVIPKIYSYFPEIDELTSEYITLLSSKIEVDKSDYKSGELFGNQMSRLFETGIYKASDKKSQKNYSEEVDDFKEKQAKGVIQFARFCGISTSQLPCIAFFPSLHEPDNFLIWNVSSLSAESIVQELRHIIANIEKNYPDLYQAVRALDIHRTKKGDDQPYYDEWSRLSTEIVTHRASIDKKQVIDSIEKFLKSRSRKQTITNISKSIPMANFGLNLLKLFH
ncbi:hypothetical protein R9C00_09685 [Flammeovirgaceae bacterium SG7u.111]|nr:hypothetical protein [Flammeovirgaceae bacterium SG7u.132]WPO37721.1 hypothetical protein R9C00_09685 [Flammeovirgaceae bacterium SG7u.111]